MKLANEVNYLIEAKVKVKKLELIDTKKGRGKFDLISPMRDSDFESSKKWVGYDVPYGFGIGGSAIYYKRNLGPKKSLTVSKNGFRKWVVYEYNYYGKEDKKEWGGVVGWTGHEGKVVIDSNGWETPEKAMDAANKYYNLK